MRAEITQAPMHIVVGAQDNRQERAEVSGHRIRLYGLALDDSRIAKACPPSWCLAVDKGNRPAVSCNARAAETPAIPEPSISALSTNVPPFACVAAMPEFRLSQVSQTSHRARQCRVQLDISLSKTGAGSSTSTSRFSEMTQIRVATARTKARSWLTRRQAAPCSINSLSSMSWPLISR
jgi:hypothetical protein